MNISPLSKKKCIEPYSKSVLYNSSLCINNKTIRFKILYEKCIIIVSDLLDENGNILSFNDLKERYNLNICFTMYMGIRRALFTAYPTLKNGVMHIKEIPYIPNFVRLLTRDKKGSRTLYDLLVQKQKPIEKYKQKWEQELHLTNFD